MHTPGHVGIALAIWAPPGYVLVASGETRLAVVGIIVALGFGLLPDVDEYTPTAHRGLTHTVWFILVAGVVAAAGGVIFVPGGAVLVSLVCGGAASLSVTAHILADSLTPMGIWPFRPLSDRHYSFDLVASRDVRANIAAVLVGLLSWLPTLVVLFP